MLCENLFTPLGGLLNNRMGILHSSILTIGSKSECLEYDGWAMQAGQVNEIDFIEELKLRRWARENYVPHTERNETWHPIIHDEMGQKDREHRHDRLNMR